MCGVAIAAIIHAGLGVAPWDVLHQGLSKHTGIPIGTVIIGLGFLVLLAWIPLHVRPGPGTVLNAVLVGLSVDVVDPHLPEPGHPLAQVALLATGLVLFAVGTGLYIGAGMGPGPRDGLMTGLANRGLSIRVARTGLEVVVFAVGVVLGGSVGVGTAAFAFGIGPLVQLALPRLRMTPAVPAPAVATAA